MVGIFSDDSQNESFESTRRARFLQLMLITRKFPMRRPVPLPNARPGIIFLGIMGTLISLIGICYFGSSLQNFVENKIEATNAGHQLERAQTKWGKSHHPLNTFSLAFADVERTLILGTDALRKVDSDGIKLYSFALATATTSLIGFILVTLGAWLENTRLLLISLAAFSLAWVLEVVTVVKDANSTTVKLFHGSYSVTIITFTLMLISITWVMAWLHHRWLSYEFGHEREKHVQHTPLYDNV